MSEPEGIPKTWTGTHWRKIPSRMTAPTVGNPMTWSVVLVQLFGITIRLHAVFLAAFVVIIIRSVLFRGADGGVLDVGLSLILVVWMFWAVLASELSVALSVRWLGGACTEIVLHPLGGLDACIWPPGWSRRLLASLVSFVALMLIGTVCAVYMYLAAPGNSTIPLAYPFSLDGLYSVQMTGSWLFSAVFILEWMCVLVCMCNLLPLPCFHGWHIMQSLLRTAFGWGRAQKYSIRIGIVTVLALVFSAWYAQMWIPLLISIFGAVCIREEFVRIKHFTESLGHERDDHALLHIESMLEQDEAASSDVLRIARIAKVEALRRDEEDNLDRILQKISREGHNSLTRGDRRVLKRATQRRKGNTDS